MKTLYSTWIVLIFGYDIHLIYLQDLCPYASDSDTLHRQKLTTLKQFPKFAKNYSVFGCVPGQRVYTGARQVDLHFRNTCFKVLAVTSFDLTTT